MNQPEIAKNGSPVASLCELKGINHEFVQPSGAKLQVLHQIDLAVFPGEVVCLLGPSGCGKSTILRILAGLIRPSSGQVLYHGKALEGLNPGVAIVFQSFALFPWMTVTENIRAVLRAAKLPQSEIEERSTRAIKIVGLAGFEDSYPRELSGGMKQRVGMARAFSLNPEMLFMDEPFSQVDALTAESLRAEVLDIWASKSKAVSSILMVSHDIKEVVYMADRIIVLGAHPGTVQTVLENKLPRPRDYRSPALNQLVDRLHDIITGHELPDVVPPPGTAMEPLPQASGSEIIGLLEYLDAREGREEIFRIANDTGREFGTLINVVKAAELLEFVDTPKRLVVLEEEGRRMVKALPDERKVIWRERLMKLGLFQKVLEAARKSPDKSISREFALETIILSLPSEDFEKMFETLVNWGQFGDLLSYDEATEAVTANY